MKGHRILVAESRDFPPGAAADLKDFGELTLADVDRVGLLAAVKDADVLWVRLRHRIDAEVMEAAPRLRVIVTATTGLNHIDVDEARARGIHVLSLRGETEFLSDVVATAELTLGLVLAMFRHLPAAIDHVKEGGWNRDRFKGAEIRGSTAGVVGYGRLGRIVSSYLAALGARVLIADPAGEPPPPGQPVERVALPDLLARADFVTLHVALTPDTTGLFGREAFDAMKRGAWLVNTSRGEVIDEAALIAALESGHLAGAALDVLADESAAGMGDRAIVQYARTHPALIITPHIGGCTAASMHKTESFLARRLKEVLADSDRWYVGRTVMAGGDTCAE